ncbi:hypothetical protein A9993_07750 [Rahnella victoriana]|uniref:hypothetical protein n=1 Tax=Rahnella victoriana TaxID=1510570 RepID=UPI000BB19F75|nr:hypothetical protein [Rahnella victoriana]PBI79638.1 hypothetical protein A9993_07750 [Rahnella victoriana]
MEIIDNKNSAVDIPVFASTCAAASYKTGAEAYVDLMFLRSHFVINQNSTATEIAGQSGLQQQDATLVFTKVSAVTMSAGQARELINAIEFQLNNLATI